MVEIRSTLLIACATVGSVLGQVQVQEGDVVVGRINRMSLYRDGALIALTPLAASTDWLVGAAFAESGNWLTATQRAPSTPPPHLARVLVYDAGGNPLGAIPTLEVEQVADVAVFADGGLCVADCPPQGAGSLELYDASGTHTGSITSPLMACPIGLTVDGSDEIWVADCWSFVFHFARDGTLLSWFTTGSHYPRDVDEAPDGSLWCAMRANAGGGPDEVRHYSRSGVLLMAVPVQFGGIPSVGVAADGTVWFLEDFHLTHIDAAGNLLGRFLVQGDGYKLAVRTERIGVRYCASAPNSSGLPGRMHVRGSSVVANDDVRLRAEQLPPGEFGYFLVGAGQGTLQPPGSQGTFCLAGGRIGRFALPGQVFLGPTGSLVIDLQALPTFPPAAVQPGETWAFQAWFRDQGSSDFTDAVAVCFR